MPDAVARLRERGARVRCAGFSLHISRFRVRYAGSEENRAPKNAILKGPGPPVRDTHSATAKEPSLCLTFPNKWLSWRGFPRARNFTAGRLRNIRVRRFDSSAGCGIPGATTVADLCHFASGDLRQVDPWLCSVRHWRSALGKRSYRWIILPAHRRVTQARCFDRQRPTEDRNMLIMRRLWITTDR